MGNESEKKERWPEGKLDMMAARGGLLMAGHVEVHMFLHRFSLRQRSWNLEDTQPAVKRVEASSLDKICFSIISW